MMPPVAVYTRVHYICIIYKLLSNYTWLSTGTTQLYYNIISRHHFSYYNLTISYYVFFVFEKRRLYNIILYYYASAAYICERMKNNEKSNDPTYNIIYNISLLIRAHFTC